MTTWQDGTTANKTAQQVESASEAPASRRLNVAFETVTRSLASAGVAITSGRRYIMPFTAYDQRSFSSLEMFTGTSTPVSVTAARFGLYSMATNGDWTLVCQTAIDATIGAAASTQYTRALDTTGGYPASYNLVAGQIYGFAFYITATTPPGPFGQSTGSTGPAAMLPRVAGFDGGAGTDLNTAVTLANFSATATLWYGAGV